MINDKYPLFSARDSEERERWIRALEDTIKRHSQARKVFMSNSAIGSM